MNIEQLNAEFGIAGKLSFFEGKGGVTMARITAAGSEALVSCQGGQVLLFKPAGAAEDIFFLSEKAHYGPTKAIKGGAPVCWPWFANDPEGRGRPNHGFVRNRPWDVRASAALPDGRVRLSLGVVDTEDTRALFAHEFDLELEVTVGAKIDVGLITRNRSGAPMTLTGALHSYYRVGDVRRIAVRGLEGVSFIDKTDGGKVKREDGAIAIAGETDRVFLDTSAPITIDDPALGRKIVIEGSGSRSAVVWNPWIDVSTSMSDLEDDDYEVFVCVETANAGTDIVTVPPGGEHRLGMVVGLG